MCLSLQILFVYFLILPSLLHPSIYSIVFILVSILFFIAFSVIHQCHLIWFAHSTSQVPKFARARKISSHAPMPRQADKKSCPSSVAAMTLFLTAQRDHPKNGRSSNVRIHDRISAALVLYARASLATSALAY